MRALRFNAPFDVTVEEASDPSLVDSRDAIVRVVATCVCGSDLWYFRGDNPRDAGSAIGHECIGEVVDVGADVRNIRVGDFVVVPFLASCGECRLCRDGQLQSCSVAAEAGVVSLAESMDRADREAQAARLKLGREHPAILEAVRILGAEIEEVRDLGGVA